jgi:hypothetical protein
MTAASHARLPIPTTLPSGCGYYHAKRGNTLVDTQRLKASLEKIKIFCRMNRR